MQLGCFFSILVASFGFFHLFNKLLKVIMFQPSLKFLRKHCTEMIITMDSCLVDSVNRLMECFFAPFSKIEVTSLHSTPQFSAKCL